LLKPRRISSNDYRIYGQPELDRLQQILFYRELGVELSEIKLILSAKDFSSLESLQSHHAKLCAKKAQLDQLIETVSKSIKAMKGEIEMSDNEKFAGFKQNLIDENEKQYGEEIRGKYGDAAIDRSNAKLKGMTKAQYAEAEKLSQEVNDAIKTAFENGDPSGKLAQKACELHKKWLCCFWDSYSKEAHLGVTQMYVDDPRFTAYYDKIAPGCAVFLRDAVVIYCDKD
jgi:DNA-binding transcriptional MerR regulator